jgi:adenosine kinase
VFDPGQGLPLFDGSELVTLIDQARYVAVNDYEGRLLSERTGLSLAAIAERVQALIVTHGADGSVIHADGDRWTIPAAKAETVRDPTGCGDAYRAGLLYGIARSWDWQRTGQLASVLGALKISSHGGQNHAVDRDAVDALHHATFGTHLW